MTPLQKASFDLTWASSCNCVLDLLHRKLSPRLSRPTVLTSLHHVFFSDHCSWALGLMISLNWLCLGSPITWILSKPVATSLSSSYCASSLSNWQSWLFHFSPHLFFDSVMTVSSFSYCFTENLSSPSLSLILASPPLYILYLESTPFPHKVLWY